MFTYAQAETILAKLYGVPDERRGTFRGRLKHLTRWQIPLGFGPGKGSRIDYEPAHLYQWAFCLELEEFGMDPTAIARIIKTQWPQILGEFKKAETDGSEFMFLGPLALMSKAWLLRKKPDTEVAVIQAFKRSELADFFIDLPRLLLFRSLGARCVIFDLSRIIRVVQAASKETAT